MPDIVVFPGVGAFVGSVPDMRCVALTKKGRRCKLGVWGGNSLDKASYQVFTQQGSVHVSAVAHRNHARRILDQRCIDHDSPDVLDATLPEWVRLDLADAHAVLITPLPADWPLELRP